MAWYLYAQDHGERMPISEIHGFDYGNGDTSPPLAPPDARVAWAYGLEGWGFDFGVDTNVLNLKFGQIWPYVGHRAPYHCPMDRYLSPVQRAAGFAQRLRSVDMNRYLGGYGYDAPALGTGAGRVYRRLSDFTFKGPSQIISFMDMHPDNIAGTSFYFLVGGSQAYAPLPASYHHGAATVVFCDDHAELHRWLVPATDQPVTYKPQWYPLDKTKKDRRDVQWLWDHTTE